MTITQWETTMINRFICMVVSSMPNTYRTIWNILNTLIWVITWTVSWINKISQQCILIWMVIRMMIRSLISHFCRIVRWSLVRWRISIRSMVIWVLRMISRVNPKVIIILVSFSKTRIIGMILSMSLSFRSEIMTWTIWIQWT